MTVTVDGLKADGYKVHFTHLRHFPIGSEDSGFGIEAPRGLMPGHRPSAKGGMTYCEILDGDVVIAEGVSECSSRDNFNRKIGRDIAFGRAVADLTGVAEVRKLRKENGNAGV